MSRSSCVTWSGAVAVLLIFALATCARAAGLASAVELKPHVVLHGHDGPVRAVAFSPDGQTLASGGDDQYLVFWDLKTGRYDRVVDHIVDIHSIYFSPDGKRAGFRGEYPDALWFYDPATHRTDFISDSPRYEGVVDQSFDRASAKYAVVVPPDPLQVLQNEDKERAFIDVFDLNGGDTQEMKFDTRFKAVALASDASVLAAEGDVPLGNKQYQVVVGIVDLKTGMITSTFKGETQTGRLARQWLAFTADGGSIVYRRGGNTLAVWDIAAKRDRCVMTAPGELDVVAYSSDGRLAVGAVGKQALLWETGAGHLVATLEGAADKIEGLSISADGHAVAAASGSDVIFWALPASRLIPAPAPTTSPAALTVIPPAQQPKFTPPPRAPDDGPFADSANDPATQPAAGPDAAAAGNEPAMPEYRPRRMLRRPGSMLKTITFTPDSRKLLTCPQSESFSIWDLTTGSYSQAPVAKEGASVQPMAVSPSGRSLAGRSDDGAQIEDLSSGRKTEVSDCKYPADFLFASEQMLIIGDYKGRVAIHDLKTGKVVREFQLPNRAAQIALSPDGQFLAASGGKKVDDKGPAAAIPRTQVWDLKSGQLLASVEGGQLLNFGADNLYNPVDTMTPVAFIDGGHKLLYRYSDLEFIVMSLDGPREIRTIHLPGPMRVAAISPDGKYLAAVPIWQEGDSERSAIHLFETRSGRALCDFTGIARHGLIAALRFSPDGKTLASTSGKVALLWSLPTSFPPPATRPAESN